MCHVYVFERGRRMLRFNRAVSELGLQTWGSDTWVSLCLVLALVLVFDLHGKYSAFLLKMHSVSARYGTPVRPHFLDSCKSWFIPDEHIFPQMLTGHKSKPSSTPHVLRIHDPHLFQSKPCSLYFNSHCVLGGAGVYGKFHSASGEAPVCVLTPWVEALGRCFFLPLLHILFFTYKWEDVRKSASEPSPRPFAFMQWAERENEVLLAAYLTASFSPFSSHESTEKPFTFLY